MRNIKNEVWASCCQFLIDCFFIHYSSKGLHVKDGYVKSIGFTHAEGCGIADLYTIRGHFNTFIELEIVAAISKEINRRAANEKSRSKQAKLKAEWLIKLNEKYNKDINSSIEVITQEKWAKENVAYANALAVELKITDTRILNTEWNTLVRKLKKNQ